MNCAIIKLLVLELTDMLLIDFLKSSDFTNIAFIKVGKGAYTVLSKNGDKVQGNDSISQEALDLILKYEIPTVDLSLLGKEALDMAAMDLPMAAIYPDPPPYGSLSKAPIEFVGNLARMIGSSVYNIPSINIPSNLLRQITPKEKDMFKAFFSKDFESMAEKALLKEDLSILELPDVIASPEIMGLVELGVEVMHEHEKLRDESADLLLRFNKIPPNERLKSNAGQGMDLFTQHLMKNAQHQGLLEVYGAVAYEATLLAEGNFDIGLSWQRLAKTLSNMAEFHASKPRGKIYDQPLHFHSESALSHYTKYANKAVEKVIEINSSEQPRGNNPSYN